MRLPVKNSAAEAPPSPMENTVIFPYFRKMGILTRIKPCDLAARQYAQKVHDRESVRLARTVQNASMNEFSQGDFFRVPAQDYSPIAGEIGHPNRPEQSRTPDNDAETGAGLGFF